MNNRADEIPEESNRGTVIKFCILCAAAVVCAVVFIIFGSRKTIEPQDEAPEETAAPLPSGVPYERFFDALDEAEPGCGLGATELAEDGLLRRALIAENANDAGRVEIRTDEYGRAEEVIFTIGYIRPESPDYSVAPAVREAIEAEERRRTEFDEALIRKYLATVYGVFGGEYGVVGIDRSKLTACVIRAYENGTALIRNVGKARFFCETQNDGARFEFILTIAFTLEK